MKDAILFDLDGTLWDSCQEIALTWSRALSPYGISLSVSDVQKLMGKTTPEISALLLPQCSPEEQADALAACSREEEAYLREHGAVLFPDVEPVIRSLAERYDLCIVSNCQEGYIELFLDYFSLNDCITDFECAGRTGRPKGENIRAVVARNGFDRAIYLGDTYHDYESADFAGIPFIHAAYGFGHIQTPVPSIQSFRELPEWLDIFFLHK